MKSRMWSALALTSVLATTGLAVSVLAATLAITRASWGGETLSLRGSGQPGGVVTLSNPATGAVLRTAKVEGSGRWKATIEKPARVPCRVRATQGTFSVDQAVDHAPANCEGTGPATTLTGLTIAGPTAVPENGTAAYTATATFSDNTTQAVTQAAAWSENSVAASIAAGVLTTTAVTASQSVVVTSSYAAGGVTRSATLTITIQDVPATPPVTGSHAGRFTAYEGTKTCLTCHTGQAMAFHQSVHYQWAGDASEAEGLSTTVAGKMGGINDFCIYPDINWLGKLVNVDGQQVDGGCARCHTGLGARPTAEASQAQLENIDCLVCHSPGYKRTLAVVNGAFTFVPDTANMTVSVLQAAADLRLPGKDACLNCHTKAGGGDNFKRGDIEEAHRTATTSLDVHMAPAAQGGAGLSCTDCHVTVGHRIPGRGVDMRERDGASPAVACSNCHTSAPHGDARLDRHTARVACNVCHVPSFAKTAPTDMRRDWSLPGEVSAVTRLFEPHMDLQTNVTPVYRFFNGRSRFYEFATPAVPQANGRVLMAGPLGSVSEPGAKITAMKRHEGRQPVDPLTRYLLPLKIGVFFQTGDLAGAVTQGVAAVGWPSNGYEFAETERFMGIYHEVAPKGQALGCSTCHDGNRLDFAALGYTPVATRNGKPLCASCHGAKTATFYDLHNKHVTDKRIDCSSCHTFSKAL